MIKHDIQYKTAYINNLECKVDIVTWNEGKCIDLYVETVKHLTKPQIREFITSNEFDKFMAQFDREKMYSIEVNGVWCIGTITPNKRTLQTLLYKYCAHTFD